MTFHMDQALHITEVQQMIQTRKPRLIGPIVYTRIIEGRGFFIGPHYYYLLALLGIIFDFNVILITKFLLLMWWTAAFSLFIWIGKELDWYTALFTYAIFSLHPFLVAFSKMFLNPSFLAFFATPFFFFLWKAYKENKTKYWFWAGLFCGIGLSFHFLVLSWISLLGAVWIFKALRKKAKPINLLLAAAGVVIGDLPYFIFELRHNFYNLRTIIHNGLDPNGMGFLGPYYALGFLPLIFFAVAIIYKHTLGRLKKALFLPLSVLLLLFMVIYYDKLEYHRKGYGMPNGWSVPLQKQLAEHICSEQGGNHDFVIAANISSIATADDLKWFVRACGSESLDNSAYPYAKTLYYIDQGEVHNLEATGLWELASMTNDPHEKVYSRRLNDNLWFYKMVRL